MFVANHPDKEVKFAQYYILHIHMYHISRIEMKLLQNYKIIEGNCIYNKRTFWIMHSNI